MPIPKLNASSLDLRPLYYFVQVAELGSFSRAAASLSMSQPVLSRFIKRLEDDLQVLLLHRHGRGVTLTEAGERLFDHAGPILRGLSQAQTEVVALRGTALGAVSIALPPMLGAIVSTELVRRLRSEYPLISVTLREGFAAETLDWLGSGAVDVGIVFNPPHIATLISEHVLDDQIHLVGTPASLDLISGSRFQAKRLAGLPMVLPPAPHRLRTLVDEAAHHAGVKFNVEVEATGTNTILELVRNKIGYTALPSCLLHDEVREGRLQSWPIVSPKITTKLFVTTSMQRPQTMATKVVIKIIGALFAQYRKAPR
ncbi:MAG TPA: LysR family transcriptional regulator [Xanthobacteraceae bacterium]|nr:LysR family transcriptional regulator [Xanthobacteraceae bacterium]